MQRRTFILAMLSYLGTLCFIPLVRSDHDEFILFHARQGLILWAWSVVAAFFLLIPGIGIPVFVISIMCVVALSLVGIVSVASGKRWKLPVIYKLSQEI